MNPHKFYKMITSITFQFRYNKNYLNSAKKNPRVYDQQTTEELQKHLAEDISLFNKIKNLIEDFNGDLNTKKIQDKIIFHLGTAATINPQTKRRRTYFIEGLTIHEEDTPQFKQNKQGTTFFREKIRKELGIEEFLYFVPVAAFGIVYTVYADNECKNLVAEIIY